ncbi:MAG: bifunctional nuclease family protein [Candidatus Aminicenantes bacterium]|nr:bifunctional nuclease family protein [Candidatus Aminicenantes bacterium]MBL7083533.1 bifunctional nuclease family protein [Candidatus Aminicenantes bacterium]NQT79270.1 bifunctional nuclease family protein [Candidatus Aminicenantes bacterium]
MEIEMKIKGLVVDPISKMPIVVLEDSNNERMLPIWIGVFEANAIALKIENISTPRPMTHDLVKTLLDKLNISIDKIVVNDVRDNTFYALIHCRYKDQIFTIDSRPSDAIALSLRVNAPIFVNEEVVKKAHSLKFDDNLEDSEKLKKWLENLKPENLGKYKM